jgi:hypothetical protein
LLAFGEELHSREIRHDSSVPQTREMPFEMGLAAGMPSGSYRAFPAFYEGECPSVRHGDRTRDS